MIDFKSQKNYSLVTGGILFLIGLFGFIFKASVDISAGYLFASLILGFWGIVVAFGAK